MPASEQEWQEFRDRAARAVRHGAALLDREEPEWFRRIDTAHLEMQFCRTCILGQIFGDYTEGLLELNFDPENETVDVPYGFVLEPEYEERFGDSAWMELGRCWREEIKRREADHGGNTIA